MTKTAGIEGASVIAYDCAHKLNFLSESEIETAKSLLNEISVVKEGLFAAKNGATLMHDVTEGGILGALWEMAYNLGRGCEIDIGAIDIHPVTKKICDNLEINPYRLLSSGCMLIVCKNGNEMVQGLKHIGINAKVIARITDKAHGVKTTSGEEVSAPRADELFGVV
jgi:hydrogenase maturation factor